MKNTISIVCTGLLLTACATTGSTPPIPNSSIKPPELLEATYQSWLRQVSAEYHCNNPSVIEVLPNETKVKGVISEKWRADVCGQTKNFFPTLSPDGTGGYLIGIGS
jgi:hypothetical protein